MAQERAPTILNLNAAGEAQSRPDMATITIGVRNTGTTAQGVMAANAVATTELVRVLRRAGIAERDIQTGYISLYPYNRSDESRDHRFEAQNSVRAIIRDIGNTGRIIDASIAGGANTLSGVYFGLQDPAPQIDQARLAALADARGRAEIYARALGMRVERVISVTEAGAAPPPGEIIVTAARRSGESMPTPVAPGQLTTRANISVAFELR